MFPTMSANGERFQQRLQIDNFFPQRFQMGSVSNNVCKWTTFPIIFANGQRFQQNLQGQRFPQRLEMDNDSNNVYK
jgi:hypothetical protein